MGDHLREHVDDGLQDTELGAESSDVASDGVDIAIQGVNVGGESANMATNGVDMLANGIDVRLLDSSDVVHGVDLSIHAVDIDAKGASGIKKRMLDDTEDVLQDALHVGLSDAMSSSVSQLAKTLMKTLKNGRHVDTTSGEVLLNGLVLNGVVDSMLDKAVKVGLAMKTLDHVLNAGADVGSLGALTTETITLSDGAGELDKENSGLAHAVPLRAGGITTSLAETDETSMVIKGSLDVVVRSGGGGELSVSAGLGKLTSHTLDHRGVDGMTVDDDSDGGLGRGHVTSTVTLGEGSGRTVNHGAISDRGLDVNARVNREGRGLGRLVLGGGLGVDRKLGLSRSHCFGLVVDV